MTTKKDELLKKLGFSDELLAKINEENTLVEFSFKEHHIFDCISVENEDFADIKVKKTDAPFVSSIVYNE